MRIDSKQNRISQKFGMGVQNKQFRQEAISNFFEESVNLERLEIVINEMFV